MTTYELCKNLRRVIMNYTAEVMVYTNSNIMETLRG